MPTWFTVSISCLLIYLVFAIWAQVQFGSYRYALSYLKGSRLQMLPVVASIGTHAPGEVYQTSIMLRNHGRSPVLVLGALAGCACTANRDLPKVVPPGESCSLPIAIRFGEELGDWRQWVTYLTNDPRDPALRVDLVARVIAPSVRNPSQSEARR